jgi:hypothetical protein
MRESLATTFSEKFYEGVKTDEIMQQMAICARDFFERTTAFAWSNPAIRIFRYAAAALSSRLSLTLMDLAFLRVRAVSQMTACQVCIGGIWGQMLLQTAWSFRARLSLLLSPTSSSSSLRPSGRSST